MTSKGQLEKLVTERSETAAELLAFFLHLLDAIADNPDAIAAAREEVADFLRLAKDHEDTFATRAPVIQLLTLRETSIAEGEAKAYEEAAKIILSRLGAVVVGGRVPMADVDTEAERIRGLGHRAEARSRAGHEGEELTDTKPAPLR